MDAHEQRVAVDRAARRQWLIVFTPLVATFAAAQRRRARPTPPFTVSARNALAFDEDARLPLFLACFAASLTLPSMVLGIVALATGDYGHGKSHVSDGETAVACAVFVIMLLAGLWLSARRVGALEMIFMRCASVPGRVVEVIYGREPAPRGSKRVMLQVEYMMAGVHRSIMLRYPPAAGSAVAPTPMLLVDTVDHQRVFVRDLYL